MLLVGDVNVVLEFLEIQMRVPGRQAKTAVEKSRMDARSYFRATSGTTAMMFALSMPALMAAVGVASDFAIFNMKLTSLQNAADQAAIASARELALATSKTSVMQETANSYVLANLGEAGAKVKTTVSVSANKTEVTVKLEEIWSPFFAHFIGAKIMPVVVSATAALRGESRICVLTLESSGAGSILMTNSSSIVAKGCSVYSNSSNAKGISLADSSYIDASLVCSAGGVKNNSGSVANNFSGDCPPIPDPLTTRPAPKFGGCDNNKFSVSSGTVTLDPGVYCGGLKITGDAQVVFKPGDYVIKDGPFEISKSAQARGKDIGFFLSGSHAKLTFLGDAEIDFSGREKGVLAGMLFFEDPNTAQKERHTISATDAHTLTGTIYLPSGTLLVDPNAQVANKSAYTAIIVKNLVVQNGPSLVLNSNYAATAVPVPEGVVTSNQIVLVE